MQFKTFSSMTLTILASLFEINLKMVEPLHYALISGHLVNFNKILT